MKLQHTVHTKFQLASQSELGGRKYTFPNVVMRTEYLENSNMDSCTKPIGNQFNINHCTKKYKQVMSINPCIFNYALL